MDEMMVDGATIQNNINFIFIIIFPAFSYWWRKTPKKKQRPQKNRSWFNGNLAIESFEKVTSSLQKPSNHNVNVR